MLNSQSFIAPEEFLDEKFKWGTDARRYERGWPFEFVVVSDYVSLIAIRVILAGFNTDGQDDRGSCLPFSRHRHEILVVLESRQFGCYL